MYEKNNKTVCHHNNSSVKKKHDFAVFLISKIPIWRIIVEYELKAIFYISQYKLSLYSLTTFIFYDCHFVIFIGTYI